MKRIKTIFISLIIILLFSGADFAQTRDLKVKFESNVDVTQDLRAFEKEVIRLVNVERARVGLKPLKENVYLGKVARTKSQDMINKKYFSHYSPTYGSPFNMMKKFGIRYTAAGENIAMGQRIPKEVMNAWMASPGHRRNILSPTFTQIGVGVAKDSRGRLYMTQMFIRP